MPKFYFDVMINGTLIKDEAGMVLPDVEAARDECLTAAREDTVRRLVDGGGMLNGAFLITEGAGGDPLLTVPFEATLLHPKV